jgi:hypothetical protein
MALDDGTWSPHTLAVSPLASREDIISGESWLVYLLPPVVPILLVGPQMEGSSGAAWLREVVQGASHEEVSKYVFDGGANQQSAV